MSRTRNKLKLDNAAAAALLQLQQHCIELGRARWQDKVKITESVAEIPFDIRVRLDQELASTSPCGQ